MTRSEVVTLIETERARQDTLRASGHWPRAPKWVDISPCGKAAILGEEMGEVARAAQGLEGLCEDGGDLRKELVQLAALAVAWLETL